MYCCFKEIKPSLLSRLSSTQQESRAEPAQEVSVSDNQTCSRQEEQLAATQEGDSAPSDPATSTGLNTREQEETNAEKRDEVETEQQETEGGGGGECDDEGKGVKRKREEGHMEEEAGQSTEKKKVKMNG